jgi:hypothetical protein
MNHKAQGTIEYLVIIAIVVVIALVVVGLLLQILGNFGTMSETSLKTAWKSAEPWAITDWSRATDGNITLVLKNNSAETMTIRDVNLSTLALDSNAVIFPNIAPGATVTIKIKTTTACSASSKYSFPKSGIGIDYNTAYINKRQYGVADIAGTC